MNYKRCWWCRKTCHKDCLTRIDTITGYKVCPLCMPLVPPLMMPGDFDVELPTSEKREYRCALGEDAA